MVFEIVLKVVFGECIVRRFGNIMCALGNKRLSYCFLICRLELGLYVRCAQLLWFWRGVTVTWLIY